MSMPGVRWYLGSMNDGFFIINTPPRPSNDDGPMDRVDGPSLVLAVDGLSQERAQAIVDAHNVAPDGAAELREALRELLAEVDAAGLGNARDFRWPKVTSKARALLKSGGE